jgi:hypothetical protein
MRSNSEFCDETEGEDKLILHLTVVTICTTCCALKYCPFSPHSIYYIFCMIQVQFP